MRIGNGDGEAVLPWHVIRQDGNGNRYRVGSYATRGEAQRVADRLTAAAAARSDAPADASSALAGRSAEARGRSTAADSYLVEPMEPAESPVES